MCDNEFFFRDFCEVSQVLHNKIENDEAKWGKQRRSEKRKRERKRRKSERDKKKFANEYDRGNIRNKQAENVTIGEVIRLDMYTIRC